MRKHIYTIAAAAAAMIAAVSCRQELNIDENSSETKTTVFTATTDAPMTKTALDGNETDGYAVNWQNGDEITIVDGNGHLGIYTTESTTSTGSFTFKSGEEATTAPYKAYYPATLYNSGTVTLPATQEYMSGNIKESPMYAESSTEGLEFKNLTGIIRLNLTTTQSNIKVRKIVLSADHGMSGAISNAASLATDSYIATVSGTAGVTLDCGESGVVIGTLPTSFHIAVPAGTYTPLSITVYTTNGFTQTRTSKSGITVSRSKITSANLSFNNLQTIFKATASNLTSVIAEFNASEFENPTLLLTEDYTTSSNIIITREDGILDLGGHSLTIWAGSYTKALCLQNNVLNKAVTITNGKLSRQLDGNDSNPTTCYYGTVILKNITFDGHLFTDGHRYELTDVNFINGCGSSRLQNYYYSGSDTPNTVVINSGLYNCDFYVAVSGTIRGETIIYGGKFRINPSTIDNVTIPAGYSVKSNTDSDSGTYPYVVSID